MDLRIKDVAELLNVPEDTVRKWLSVGEIPAYLINDEYRFSLMEIEDWVMRHKDNSKKQSVSTGTKQFSLYRAINKGAVLDDVPGTTRDEVIRNTMKRLSKLFNLDAEVVTDLLLTRENLHPTALNHGLAVPHSRDFLLDAHYDVITIVYPENPIPYGALDGAPVHTLFFLFACEDKRHLNLLAKIAHLSSQPESLSLLQSKINKEKLLEHIREWESRIPTPK